MTYRVAYAENPAASMRVTLIKAWERGEIEMVMSASSGPKDYIRNHICAIFDRYPAIARVLMVRGEFAPSPPFLLIVDAAGLVWDMGGKPVEVLEDR